MTQKLRAHKELDVYRSCLLWMSRGLGRVVSERSRKWSGTILLPDGHSTSAALTYLSGGVFRDGAGFEVVATELLGQAEFKSIVVEELFLTATDLQNTYVLDGVATVVDDLRYNVISHKEKISAELLKRVLITNGEDCIVYLFHSEVPPPVQRADLERLAETAAVILIPVFDGESFVLFKATDM